ncbi:MAG: hypothetical protein JJ969_18250 [Rhizobiaceae bacterium]|nr:hypothetical protein [Rhizobiaceae bacterium]
MIIGNALPGPFGGQGSGNSQPPSSSGGSEESSQTGTGENTGSSGSTGGASQPANSGTSGGNTQSGGGGSAGSSYGSAGGVSSQGYMTAAKPADDYEVGAAREYSSAAADVNADREAAIAMQATARIMSLVASMRQVDEVSAYSLFDRPTEDTDAYRQATSAYAENAE